jgi:hypothetical protein
MATAKLIVDGDDQILLIPDEFYVRAKTVRFRKDEETGDIIMSPVHPRRRKQKKKSSVSKDQGN